MIGLGGGREGIELWPVVVKASYLNCKFAKVMVNEKGVEKSESLNKIFTKYIQNQPFCKRRVSWRNRQVISLAGLQGVLDRLQVKYKIKYEAPVETPVETPAKANIETLTEVAQGILDKQTADKITLMQKNLALKMLGSKSVQAKYPGIKISRIFAEKPEIVEYPCYLLEYEGHTIAHQYLPTQLEWPNKYDVPGAEITIYSDAGDFSAKDILSSVEIFNRPTLEGILRQFKAKLHGVSSYQELYDHYHFTPLSEEGSADMIYEGADGALWSGDGEENEVFMPQEIIDKLIGVPFVY